MVLAMAMIIMNVSKIIDISHNYQPTLLASFSNLKSFFISKDVEQCYYHGVVKDWQGGEILFD